MLLYDKDGSIIGELYDTKPTTKKKTIALVVGHDANSKGAYGDIGISEFDYWDGFLNDNVSKFNQDHQYYIFYRNADIIGYTAKMEDLHSRIDGMMCDISIEFHFNSFSDSKAQGHEVLCCKDNINAIALATNMNDCLTRYLPNSNRGIKKIDMNTNGGGFVCRGNSIPILVEPYFAAHQNLFVIGSEQYDNLVKSIIEFTNKV